MQEGCRKRGRPQLRWEDCVKRDLRKAEEEEKWREKANNGDKWKQSLASAAILFIVQVSPCLCYNNNNNNKSIYIAPNQ